MKTAKPNSEENFNIVIIGTGAAGLMAAIQAGSHTPPKQKIILIDRRQRIGAKILISGGTRCNVTNLKVSPSDYEGGPSHFVQHALEAFTPSQTIHFFEKIGVGLVLEPPGKYFPTTHSGKTVLEALIREAERLGVELKTGIVIDEVRREKESFHLLGKYEAEGAGSYELFAKKVILTTGGLSYPETGSDGTGYRIAKSLGHSVVETKPALTPLLTNDEVWPLLSGVALPVKLSFYAGGRKKAQTQGSFLFTHFGFSGPAALDLSRHWAKAKADETPKIEANFLSEENEAAAWGKVSARHKESPHKRLKTVLIEEFLLPARFVEIFLSKIGCEGGRAIREFKENELKKLAHTLLHYPLEVSGVYGYKKAEVTAGGVDLREVNVSTMESKKVPGLYFAGEILDVDGRIGGFNFQWAWSTGAIAGRSAAKSLD